MAQVSVTVKNQWAPIVIYFSLDWDGGGHEETNRFYENQSKTLSADIPDGSKLTLTIYKLNVGWMEIYQRSFVSNEVPSCFKVTGTGHVELC